MESKFFIGFMGIVVLIGLIYGMSYSEAVDRLQREVNQAARTNEYVDRQIETQKGQLELRTQSNTLAVMLRERTAEKVALEDEIKRLEKAEPELTESMNRAILKVREDSVGMTFPQVVLTKGVTLKNVRIQRTNEDSVLLQHDEGVKTARVDDLPAELQDRLRLGQVVVAPSSKSAEELMKENAAKKESANMQYQEQLQRHQKGVLEAQLLVNRLQAEVNVLENQVRQAETDAQTATSATQKFQTKVRRDQLKTQLAALQRSLTNSKIDLQRREGSPPQEPLLKKGL